MKNDRHIWEGWTVQSFIDDLQPIFNMVIRNQSHIKPFKTKEELKSWCKDHQPYYKKHIPEVYNHFLELTELK